MKVLLSLLIPLLLTCVKLQALAPASDTPVLESLTELKYLSFQQAFKNNDIIMLFQPDCSVCKAQIKELNCLKAIKLLGTNGSKDKLSTEYKRFKTKLPAYTMTLKDLKKINPNFKTITPQYFQVAVDSYENISLKNLGYGFNKCEKLIKNLMTK